MHSKTLSWAQKIVSWITILTFALPIGFMPIATSANGEEFGSIHAFKFYDANGDGAYFPEDGDYPLEGWEICLEGEEFEECKSTMDEESEMPGWVWFEELPFGEYWIWEEYDEDDWVPTTDSEQLIDLGGEDGDEVIVEFGNRPVMNAIHAFKYWDRDFSEYYDEEDDELLVGWKICLIDSENFDWDAFEDWIDFYVGELGEEEFFDMFDDEEDFLRFLITEGVLDSEDFVDCQFTDPDGWVWWMDDLEDGEYLVVEELPDGWIMTGFYYEDTGDVDVEDVDDGVVYIEMDGGEIELFFGNSTNAIHAYKYNDVNANGEQDEGEPALPGWEICLLDLSGFDEEDFEDWAEYYMELWDIDEEEFFDMFDDELDFLRFLVLSGDLDDIVDCQLTDENGWVWWMPVEEGEYLVVEELPDGWSMTGFYYEDTGDVDVEDVDDGVVYIEMGEGEIELFFGNHTNAIHAFKFNDLDGDGDYEPEDGEYPIEGWGMCLLSDTEELEDAFFDAFEEFADDMGFDEGDIEDFFYDLFGEDYDELDILFFLVDEGYIDADLARCEETNEDGWVWWMPVEEGEYLVVEELPDGWTMTGFYYEDTGDVEVDAEDDGIAYVWMGEGEVELFFGNQTNSIHAFKFNDVDGDGDYDPEDGDIPISDWEICLFEFVFFGEEEGEEEADLVSCQLTDEDGWVWWMDLWPGEYLVEEEEQDGWVNTTENDPEFVELEGGDVVEIFFGNKIILEISDEAAAAPPLDGTTLTVTWVTTTPATSRVVYDLVSHPALGSPPNYGYAFSTVEDPTLVTNHSVTIAGLISLATYYYRAVSHGSPEVVGGEGSVTTGSPPFASSSGPRVPWPPPEPEEPEATEPPVEEESAPPSEPASEPELEPEPEPVGEEEPAPAPSSTDSQITVPPPPPPTVPDSPFVLAPQLTPEPTEEPAEPTEEPVIEEEPEPEEPSPPPAVAVIPDIPEGEVQPRPSLFAAALGTIGFMRWFILGFVVIGWALAAPRAYRMAKASIQKEE